MKERIKDATMVWLFVETENGNSAYLAHWFPTKGKAACGKVPHPTTQPRTVYVRNKHCQVCAGKAEQV